MTHFISLLFWLILIPFCMGLLPVSFIAPQKRNPGLVFLAGYFFMWGLFEVVCIPAVLWVKYHNFSVASNLFMTLVLMCAAAGVLLFCRNGKKGKPSLLTGKRKGEMAGAKLTLESKLEWLLFFILVGFQLYKAAAYASFDGDDAYYVVESLIAQQADVMYRILPYTGRPTDLDVRHALAVFPMWVAFVAVRSDIHATAFSHAVLPFVLIPLTYLVYYEIGKRLFRIPADTAESKREAAERADGWRGTLYSKETLPVFMIIMAVFQMFGNVSIYTSETFFLTRTWQGKAVAGSLIVPAVLWLMLWLYDEVRNEERTDRGLWFLLVCVNMSAGICSSIAIFLVSVLIAVTAFVLMLVERNVRLFLKFGIACIPNLIYMGIYVVVGYSYLLK